jgi:hypothetical protein
MKKSLIFVVLGMFVVFGTLSAIAGQKSVLELTAGQEVYACNCGEACPCDTLSNNPGKCTCGKDLVKAKVVSVGDGKAGLIAEGWEKPREFAVAGKYVCACGPQCPCDTISQNPGKCTCGVEMKAVN